MAAPIVGANRRGIRLAWRWFQAAIRRSLLTARSSGRRMSPVLNREVIKTPKEAMSAISR